MVFTGEMDQITRHEAEEKAKAAGAKVSWNGEQFLCTELRESLGQRWTKCLAKSVAQVLSAVSGNVQFLVAASLAQRERELEIRLSNGPSIIGIQSSKKLWVLDDFGGPC